LTTFDKAKVEQGVRLAQTYILGRLRHQIFFSLADCNTAIRAALGDLNGRPMRRIGVSRKDLFETIERPALRPLPAEDYEFAVWQFARVGPDYHIEVEKFFYSVPHGLIRAQVDVRMTTRIVEIFHKGRRVASHQRRYHGRRHGTYPDHMPSSHRRYADWSPERFKRWVRSFGGETEGLIIAILANRPHPEQGFRTCLGVLRLLRGLEPERAEAVSAHAVDIGALTYKSIASIVEHNTDRHRQQTQDGPVIDHPNLRGANYFH
jgi:transposase